MTQPRLTQHRPLQGRVAMITGANGDMGRVIATDLARQGAEVMLVVRRHEQGEALKREIAQVSGSLEVEFLVADLSDQASIRRMVEAFHRRHRHLHVLVNNAGIHLQERKLSVDGLEMHFAVNHLGWFLLTHLLLDTLKASAPARIVNVTSKSMADARQLTFIGKPQPAVLNLNDLQSEGEFEAMQVYARSKLAMLMCGYALARHLQGTGVTVNALHPGLVATSIVADVAPSTMKPFLGLVRKMLLTPEEGARTAIYLATSPSVEGVTGKYFIKEAQVRSPEASYDVKFQEQLWQASAALVGLNCAPVPG